ncbi:MAG: hypothetical protein M5U12_32235 [Verrucomicrobia bacterium]|nr:hypothetical protein [Verrucomicrobiota bacterium]
MLGLSVAAGCFADDAWTRLREDRDLTPAGLLQHFAGFGFELGETLQDAETFLRRRRGDCDDFASLASQVLTERGWHPKLVVVMMERQTHVVCYVQEAKGFLDYNRRAVPDPVVASDGSLEDIAAKVATAFRSEWWMASEFAYRDQATVFLDNAFPSAVVAKVPVESRAETEVASSSAPVAAPATPKVEAAVPAAANP